MNNELRNLLEEEIEAELDDISRLEVGSEEHSKAVVSFEKLYKLKLEEDKLEIEKDEKNAKRELEREQHEQDVELKKDQFNKELELKERQIDNEVAARDSDDSYRTNQLRVQRNESIVKVITFLVELTAYYVITNKWMKRGYKFEETGTITSPTTKNIYNSCTKPRRR